ncbi:MAG TPA: amidohydrolase family protein [Burkholderiales bacterium]|nr:amidohydrolase family protein [Burkholderiales bacterium]
MPERLPAADCHAHVFCGDRYPHAPDALYAPDISQAGTARKFADVLHAHSFTHGLLVGAGVYGADNRCLVEACRQSQGRFKGIALVRPEISERELSDLSDSGIVGVRINVMNHGMKPLVEPGADALLAKLKALGWFVQVQVAGDQLVEAAPILRKAGVRVMIDHIGRPVVSRGVGQPGFQALLELGREGNAVVKLSGPFRSSEAGYPYEDVDPFVEAAIDAFTLNNCIWGSDWPFVRMDERMDYGLALVCLPRWLPDAQSRRDVLWNNPKRLFGFE